MESETNQDSFGGYLKGFRVKQELAIQTVAEKTKIAVHCLKAIEENAHDRLPPQAYVKSFIRTYAHAVGANADVAVGLYLSEVEQQEHAKQQSLRRRKKLGAVRRAIMAVGVIISILLLLRYSDFFMDPVPTPSTAAPKPNALPEPSATGVETADGSLPSVARTKDKLKLKVIAVKQTWLKVIVDGQNARSYNLKPEDRLELEGTHNFNLMIGNATGLQIFLNEQPVKIFGSSDQVVSLKIP
ncbi:RodZ domain-containing protein [uncultured Desulfosarcina sp.]|uniref:helix-turn-helix domain-containing protein n=1 Tax=uncultured Desulfosarcina sp. TaxID=218289 RepID=UPI0029C9B206|nr:RodZ domain-containing protein [uncultured Desulfosarcina sp.]